MSLRLEMLQVARLAPKLLGESGELVRNFLLEQQNPDGGFRDRAGKSDLYYTVFGLDGLLALEIQNSKFKIQSSTVLSSLKRSANYLRSFGEGAELDFVHMCALARTWSAVEALGAVEPGPAGLRAQLLRRLATFRSEDGGFHPVPGSRSGTAYAAFLALGAYQDMQADLPDSLRLVQSLKFLETEDGAWANERNIKVGSTNATAAAITLLRNLAAPVNQRAGDWLLARCHAAGGFLAAPGAPMPDLLSTATTLHALAGLELSFAHLKENCLDFVDSLWTNDGGFHGNWTDDHLDCEYTYYGLLALGHLSL